MADAWYLKQTSPPKTASLIKWLLMNMTREINLERALPRKKTKRPRDLGNDNLSLLANQHESKQASVREKMMKNNLRKKIKIFNRH